MDYQKMNENEIYFGTGQIQVEQVEKLSLEFGESSTTLGLSDRNSINIYQTNRIYNDTENDQVQMKLAELDEPSLEVEHPPELPPPPLLGWQHIIIGGESQGSRVSRAGW